MKFNCAFNWAVRLQTLTFVRSESVNGAGYTTQGLVYLPFH